MNYQLVVKTKKSIVVMAGLFALTLTGCSSIQKLTEQITVDTESSSDNEFISGDAEVDASVDMMSGGTIKVPEYYSTEYLPRYYRAGQVVEINRLQCDRTTGCNR